MKLNERFRVIAWLVSGIFVLINILFFFDPLMQRSGMLIFGAALCLWFYIDYKMLRVDRYYLDCLLISVALFLYAFLLRYVRPDIDPSGCQGPLCLLLVQKPMRLLFLFLMRREPVVDRHSENFTDRIYSVLFFILSVVCLTLDEIPRLLGWR